jgi:hypothetical protein
MPCSSGLPAKATAMSYVIINKLLTSYLKMQHPFRAYFVFFGRKKIIAVRTDFIKQVLKAN